MFLIFSYLPLFELRLTKSPRIFLSFHYMLFSRLQVSAEALVLVEVSPTLLFNVHGHRSGHMQALKI